MTRGLSSFARRFLIEPEAFSQQLTEPLVVWETTAEVNPGPLLLTTAGQARSQPSSQDPFVFEVRKQDKASNAFAMGITVGRTEANDLVFEDTSVSRFHGYFQLDTKTHQWTFVDADSKFGTWVGPMKLKPSKPALVPDGTKLRFGSVEVQFLLPSSFLRYVKKAVGG